jgi:hypothetical protein
MLVKVSYTGSEFVAHDLNGKRVTDRAVLEAIAFEPFPAMKGEFTINLPDAPTNSEQPLNINFNYNLTNQ